MKVLSGSINLAKIPKERIKIKDKNGNEFQNGAKYLEVQILLNDTPDKYGNDAQIIVAQTKEERETKSAKTYIGNCKTVWSSVTAKRPEDKGSTQQDGLPF